MGEEQIVAMADAIPPVALSLVQGHAPASTISWELEFVHHGQPVSTEGWWRMDASLVAARDGYANQDAHLYGPDGELIALSRQVVAVFA
jgi:acyl-CoA thioesterase